jgi:hypothetical protein
MKKIFFVMFVGTVFLLFSSAPVFAEEESMVALTGSIQSYDCIMTKEVCPIGMEDAMAAEADILVLLVDPVKADYYVITNVSKFVLARHINKQIKVIGYVNEKHNHIWANEIHVGKKLVWSVKMQEELHKKLLDKRPK